MNAPVRGPGRRRAADALRDILPAIADAARVAPAVRRAMHDVAPELLPAARAGTLHILAIGKASLEMVAAAGSALDELDGGVATGAISAIATADPRRASSSLGQPSGALALEVLPADHPLPTPRSVEAARRIEARIGALGERDTLLALISGGGSAHLCSPEDGLTLDDIAGVTSDLQRAGADILELNAVRKHCERLKGGRLLARCGAGRVTALVCSDVVGDPLDVIASGPLAPDPTTFAEALAVLDRRGVEAPAVRLHLQRGAAGALAETPKPGDAIFSRVSHRVILSHERVARATADLLRQRWPGAVVTVETGVTGEAATLGTELGRWARDRAAGLHARVVAGEWTVDARGTGGRGGPSQELALAAADQMQGHDHAGLLAYSTDGVDGPTDAAGAVVDGDTSGIIARVSGRVAREFLAGHDSTTALDAAGALLRTGATGTNVNHIVVAVSGWAG